MRIVINKTEYATGESTIKFPAGWESLCPLLRADLLKEWLYDIETAYEEALNEMHNGRK